MSSARQSVVEESRRWAYRAPDHVALVAPSLTISYRQLFDRIVRAADSLQKHGAAPGDRVMLGAAARPEFVYSYFGAHLLGAIAVSVSPSVPKSRLGRLLEAVEPRLFISSSERHDICSVTYGSLDPVRGGETCLSSLNHLPKGDDVADLG